MSRRHEAFQQLLPFAFNQQEVQRQILERCAATDLDVEAELKMAGLSQEDLRYEDNSLPFGVGRPNPTLERFKKSPNGVPLVSFFSGCGGLDLGFEAAGFSHVASVEMNELFCRTLRHNRPTWKVLGPPVCSGNVSEREELSLRLRSLAGISKNFEGVFVGGPPCQPFSIAANQRFSKGGDNFKRVGFDHQTNGNLLFDFLWFIELYRPAAFLIENVEGLADVDGGEQVSNAIQTLQRWGYHVESPMILDVAHFQVPQHRRRLFIVGSRKRRNFAPPRPSAELFACGDALAGVAHLPNHEPRAHKATSLLRYRLLSYGQRDRLGRVDRLHPHRPSKTVIAGGTNGGGRSHLHPVVPRTLTPRESARLQTFPDDYIFLGPTARQFTQVGNAVPPVFAAQLAHCLARCFFGK